ncbi:hypothetical protein C8Q79DRAFT_928699 [Trametes meyenii]|nr:hypothetical protein C8Q79DRAFT_928699 [Trametes meyenii]
MVQIPLEVASAIASYTAPRDLLALCCASKAFQRAAESRIYEAMVLRDAHSAFTACHALITGNALRGSYVKRMVLYQDPRRVTGQNNLARAPLAFWDFVRLALTKTVNLESLTIFDPNVLHSWILDCKDIRFQLREGNFHLPWDAQMVAFLQTQHKLLTLTVSDAREAGPLYPIMPTALPILDTFSGPLLAVAELLGSPLRRIQMAADEETAPLIPTIVEDLAKKKTLRSLCVLGLPEAIVLETVHLVSTAVFAPHLHYLGILPLPVDLGEWHHLHRALMKLPALTVIELDVTRWSSPPAEHFQRIFILELRVFSASLQHVVFWIGQHRFHWYARDGHWAMAHQAGRYAVKDSLWCS